VFGDDYDTHDGTGVRDYIHVVDLANGHVKALEKLNQNPGIVTYNLGTGNGYSVFEMIHAFENASGHTVKYKVTDRRAGDIGECYADCSKALNELGFEAKLDLNDMCTDTWRWQEANPNGYKN
ncbi:MAG: GDP-mannose 4,6-dehydratase, partial [Oscillospiraceae bacterium]